MTFGQCRSMIMMLSLHVLGFDPGHACYMMKKDTLFMESLAS